MANHWICSRNCIWRSFHICRESRRIVYSRIVCWGLCPTCYLLMHPLKSFWQKLVTGLVCEALPEGRSWISFID